MLPSKTKDYFYFRVRVASGHGWGSFHGCWENWRSIFLSSMHEFVALYFHLRTKTRKGEICPDSRGCMNCSMKRWDEKTKGTTEWSGVFHRRNPITRGTNRRVFDGTDARIWRHMGAEATIQEHWYTFWTKIEALLISCLLKRRRVL